MNFHAQEAVNCLKVYPQLDFVLATASDAAKQVNWTSKDSVVMAQNFMSKHSEIDAVWASDDGMAIGVPDAIEASDRNDIQFVLVVLT